jgi:integrase
MSKQRNPNGQGNYRKLADGRFAWRQTVDGKTRELSAKSMKELREKVKKVADLPIISEKYKVEEWFDKWLESYIKPLKKQATYDQYRYMYQGHIKPVIGHRKLTSIKSIDIQGVIAEMNKKNMATKTMKHAKTAMSGAFSKALKDKIIAENPVFGIEIPVKQTKEKKTLTNQEISLLFKQLKTSRWIWSVKFALVTGVRRGELLALKWTDIDFENKRITIDESNSLTGLGDTKSAKIHYVPLSDIAIEYLNKQKMMLEQETNPILHNEELKKTCFIFPSKYGTMIKPNSYYHVLSRAAAKVGFKASPHCLRHTFVYKTRDKFTLKELQAILGHDESTTTLDIYGDILSDDTFKVAAQIDDVFGKLDFESEAIEEKKERKDGKVIEFRRAK